MAIKSITRISTDATGVEAKLGNSWSTIIRQKEPEGPGADSWSPVFSPDGTKVAFGSDASDLVPGDTNDVQDVFIKDLATGAIERISTDAAGVQGNGTSSSLVFSPDGSKVAFVSWASNLVPGDTNNQGDIFVKDLATGAIARISTNASGVQGNGTSYSPVFSPDGSKVAFSSDAYNLVPGDSNGAYDIFVVELDDAWVAPPVVTWSIAPQSITVNETAGTVEFTLSRSGSMLAQTVYVSTMENQGAANEGDYLAKLNEPVTFAFGELVKTVTVEILDDDIPEDTETFGVVVQQSPDSSATTFLATATFTIEDNDTAEPVNQIIGTDGNDRLIGTDGNDIIAGHAGIDWLEGKGGDDVLLGGADIDWLDGGDGDDILIGGKGIDKLIGGRGADLFVVDALDAAPDLIFDFMPSEGDRLSLGPLIDRLGLRGQSDVDALVRVVRAEQSIIVTLDTNGMNRPGGVKEVALLFNSEITDPQQFLAYVDTDTLVVDHGDYWG